MENSAEATDQLLKKKYDLHKSPEVEKAAKRHQMRTGEKVPQDPLLRIQNYLNRFHEITDQTDPDKREKGIQAIKTVLLDKFVTKIEEIPESYWKSQETVLRQRGQQGDYDRFSEEGKTKWKKEISEGLLDDQRASLEQWIDYLASESSSYMPDAMKYWVFRNVVNMQEYDKEKQEFPQRSKGTIKMFPDINHEALSYVIDAVVKKYKGESFSFGRFEYDLTIEQKRQFQQALDRENFPLLYAWANEQITPIPKHLLPVTQGAWVKYRQNSDHLPLVKSIRGHGTGWCIAGESVAQNYLKAGDLYIFYSNDDQRIPTIPRIAIRMKGNKIAEVRGISHRQNLDHYMNDVLAQKLEEFPDKDQYMKKESDMKHLTEIDNKTKSQEALTKDDLTFLYELDSSIEGFGQEKDPRIKELKAQRNPEEDMPIVFGCSKDQIARSPDEVNDNTKAYVGSLVHYDNNGKIIPIFKKIGHLEHIYTTFPERKIRFQDIAIGGKTVQELMEELESDQRKVNLDYRVYDIIESPDFTTLKNPKTLSIIILEIQDLGFSTEGIKLPEGGTVFPGRPTIDRVYAKIKELGLELCPAETGLCMRSGYTNEHMALHIGMEPIIATYNLPHILELQWGPYGLKIEGNARSIGEVGGDDKFAFTLSHSATLREGKGTQNHGLFGRIFRR